jgi:hypothetical protein
MDFVQLYWKRNRGWPWPDESWGLDPMFGEDGWCHSCGTPRHPQTGPLTLRTGGLSATGAWAPNWIFDVICLERSLAEQVAAQFTVELRDVAWHPNGLGEASQIVIPTVGEAWFDHAELRDRAIAEHGTPGATCPDCGIWRWMPLTWGGLPPLRFDQAWSHVDVIASPEWFGAGCQSFRQILVRRDLAELIAAASPRDFRVQVVS